LTGCSGVLDPQGPVGAAQRIILLDATVIMLAIVVPTIIATIAFAWWFRSSNTRATYMPEWSYSGAIELVVWSIPILVIMFLSGIIWIGSNQLDPFRPLDSDAPPFEIQGVSLDWKWLFIYPEQSVAAVNELVVPANRPLHFSLTSASVLNVFFVPQLGSMIYTMNGMTTQLNLKADREGDFYGRSAHFSGDGFPDMEFTLHAVSEHDFNDWLARTKSTGPTLDQNSYAVLSLPSMAAAPMTYRNVSAGLFESIATQQLPPSPGPANRPLSAQR
jgi:cytochrome o ubiquinol oxidase subunit 2